MKDENALLERALEHHRAGKFRDAADSYKKVLRRNPKHPDALYLFGVLLHQNGNNLAASELFRKALASAPNQAQYHNALGLALAASDKYDEAEECFHRAIDLSNRAEFYNSLGALLKKQSRFSEAIDAYQQALRQDPGLADTHYNLGNAYRIKGEFDAAVESFRRALELVPEHPHALAAFGQTLHSIKRDAEAALVLRRAVALQPQDGELLCDFADVLQDSGTLSEAISAYQNALKLNPQSPRAWYSLGVAENAAKEYVPAISSFQRAVTQRPDWLEARHNLARALYEMGQVSSAFDHFQQCAAAQHEGSAQARAMIAVIIPGVPEADNSAILEARKDWVARDLAPSNPGAKIETRSRADHHPLRVGYISSFFHRDNWMKPVWGLINRHDRREFQVHLFSDAPSSSIRYGYRPDPDDQFFDTTNLSNEALAALIVQCRIDVLIDLNGYSNMRRLPLFTLRPAPVTLGWFNMYATTGMTSFDYLVGDEQVISQGEDPFYSEKVLRVSGSYLTFAVDYPVPPVSDSPYLTNSCITFGSLASQYKITDQVVESWSRILQECPNSPLILKNKHLALSSSREFVHKLFSQRGISPERVHLEGPEDHFEFLKAYDRIDVALDTFPYNGGTTTTEAIWQGVPVLAFHGDRWASRTSASILRAGGLGEFVARDVEEYISLATQLGNSSDTPDRLAELRRNMRQQLMASPVCDTNAFAREMEHIYKQC